GLWATGGGPAADGGLPRGAAHGPAGGPGRGADPAEGACGQEPAAGRSRVVPPRKGRRTGGVVRRGDRRVRTRNRGPVADLPRRGACTRLDLLRRECCLVAYCVGGGVW